MFDVLYFVKYSPVLACRAKIEYLGYLLLQKLVRLDPSSGGFANSVGSFLLFFFP